MNATRLTIFLVTVHGRQDPNYAFTNREDAEKFVRAVEGDDPTVGPLTLSEVASIDELPLIPGGGGQLLDELIAQERAE